MSDQITIIRAPRNGENPYFMERRATAQDERLSYEARGVLSYLLSKPGDWEIKVSDLQNEHCGRDKVYRIFRELKKHGYLRRQREKLPDGKWLWHPYELSEIPFTEKPYMAEPYTDLPYTAKPEIKDQSRESTKKTLAPSGAGTSSTTEKAVRTPNPMYDAIQAVWGYTGSLNGEMAKMLRGESTNKSFKAGNIEPAMTPAEVTAWAGWYRATELHGDSSLNMLEDRMKIQSSVTKWRGLGSPSAEDATSVMAGVRLVTQDTISEIWAIPEMEGA